MAQPDYDYEVNWTIDRTSNHTSLTEMNDDFSYFVSNPRESTNLTIYNNETNHIYNEIRYFNYNFENQMRENMFLQNFANITAAINRGDIVFNIDDDFIPFNELNPPLQREPININIDVEEFHLSEEDKNCCICMEQRETQQICRLNCQHIYCVDCINKHLQRNNGCPLCRTSITNIQVQNENSRNLFNL